MGKLKVAIVGCGHIANGKHMPSLAKIEEIEIIDDFLVQEMFLENVHKLFLNFQYQFESYILFLLFKLF